MRPTRSGDARLRVLTLARNAGSAYGGAEKVAFEFARRLDRERFKSYVCSTRRPVALRRESAARDDEVLRSEGIPFLNLDRRSTASVLPWWRLHAFMHREKFDIVHAHMPRASVPGSVLARLTGVPVFISHEHGSALEGDRKLARRMLDRHVVARLSTVMLAVSEWDRRNIIELEHIPPELIQILPNGIEPPPEGGGADVRAELGVPPQMPLIGAVGRLYPEKGYDLLARAVATLKERGHHFQCLIVGDGPAENERDLRRLIEQLGVWRDVRLIGRREDVADVVNALDVAVLSSTREGSPLAMIEYMAAAAPIVAPRVGGLPELAQDGVHALLVEPNDHIALADGIERLISDRALAERLGRADRERQRHEYDLDTLVTRLEELYLELFNQSSAGRLKSG